MPVDHKVGCFQSVIVASSPRSPFRGHPLLYAGVSQRLPRTNMVDGEDTRSIHLPPVTVLFFARGRIRHHKMGAWMKATGQAKRQYLTRATTPLRPTARPVGVLVVVLCLKTFQVRHFDRPRLKQSQISAGPVNAPRPSDRPRLRRRCALPN